MINFSIFIFIICAVWDAAGQIVFGSAHKKSRVRRQRQCKRQQSVRVYAVQPTATKKRREGKSLRVALIYYSDFYGSCATIA